MWLLAIGVENLHFKCAGLRMNPCFEPLGNPPIRLGAALKIVVSDLRKLRRTNDYSDSLQLPNLGLEVDDSHRCIVLSFRRNRNYPPRLYAHLLESGDSAENVRDVITSKTPAAGYMAEGIKLLQDAGIALEGDWHTT